MASDNQVAEFVGITNASEHAARRIIDMCSGDVEQSIMLWFADEDLQRTLSMPETATAASSSTSAAAPAGRSRQARRQAARQIGREDAQGVIHIDSDDGDVDGDVEMTDLEGSDGEDNGDASVARRAQEEEDAVVARRMQEELYGNAQGVDEDGVRAPMARTTETLVDPVFAGFGGFGGEEILNRTSRTQRAQNRGNPFVQSIWGDDSSVPAGGEASASEQSSRARRLHELYHPPPYISPYTIEEARDEGKEQKKWIMANLQDMSIFQCQTLNRDHWKNEAIVDLIKENFIFLQYDKNHPLSEQFINLYFPDRRHENPDTYPYVAIIDPRTGGKEKEWSGKSFPDVNDFLVAVSDFLDRYSLDPKKKNPVSTEKPKRVIDVDRMTEEEQLELALKNSMAANGNAGQPSNAEQSSSSDEDFSLDKDKDKENDKSVPVHEAASSSQLSPFQRIPSDRPHTEPPNDPSSTTRLQVRNPPARIIRRFRLDDPVSRIYEWLKAEPLPGKEGVEFELKSVGQGDLIEHLDKSIKEAGLANGTVMIEFIEEDA
ncbi:UBX domain containing protein [Rhypophila sp. PSN 637]